MTQEVGFVKSVKDFFITLDGLPGAKIGSLIAGESGEKALVFGLRENHVEAMLLDVGPVLPGQMFKPLEKSLSLSVGDFLTGRVINPLGEPLDGLPIKKSPGKFQTLDLIRPAREMSQRKFITDQFVTGVSLIDTLLPIGKGQRELIIGDARSGKTSFIIDLLTSQKDNGVICVYGLIGKPVSHFKTVLDILAKSGALKNIIVVTTLAGSPTPLSYLTPFASLSIAEHFAGTGKDVLVILDDLGVQAKIYREMALLSERFPGREAYPGDMFSVQAGLLERAGNFTARVGGGSITALPVIEVDLSQFTGFVPTNLMSMTDGHLLFKSELNSQGRRPAVDIFLSVSRVGHQTQSELQSAVATKIKQLLASAKDLSTLSSFGGELPLPTQKLLRESELATEFLKQPPQTFIPLSFQLLLLTLPLTDILTGLDESQLMAIRRKLLDLNNSDLSKLGNEISKAASLKEALVILQNSTNLISALLETGEVKKDTDEVNSETWLPPF